MGGLVLEFCSLRFGAVEGYTGGSRMIAVGVLGKEAEQTTIWVVLLELGFFLLREFAFAGQGEDAFTIFIVRFAIWRFVTNVSTGTAIAGDFILGFGGFDGGWCCCFLLVDVIGGSQEEIGWISKILPFGRNDLFNEGFLAQVFEGIFWECFDVVATDVGWVSDKRSINSGLELDNEGTETGCERLQRFGWIVAFHICELFVVGLCGSFKQG